MSDYTWDLYFENKKHTPDDFPYNTYLCSIPLDFRSVKPHWHREVEIIVIKQGQGIVHVDLIPYHVHAGDLVFVFPGQLHSIEQYRDFYFEYENILFKQELLRTSGSDYCSVNFIRPLFDGEIRLIPLIDRTVSTHDKILSLINEIDRLRASTPFASELCIKGLLFQILYFLLSAHSSELKAVYSQKSVEKIKEILRYVEQNYASRISIAQIAEHCFYSESYFMKFFKRHMGIGFIQYLNDYRLELSAELLLTTESPVFTIAESVGFDNLSYFNRSFKKKYQMSPGIYRKRAGKGENDSCTHQLTDFQV